MTSRGDERLRRLLALVPWVAAHDGPAVGEVCERFGVSETELAADLELLFLCGLHPYTPDMLIEADIADGRVWIRYAEYFARPLRLTPPEALALVAAGRTLLAVPGADPEGPLARGLAKLAAALGLADVDALDIDPGAADEALLSDLRDAAVHRRAVELDYYSFGRDEVTHRVVEPLAVFSAAGQWYLSARCRTVDDERLFRIDRVHAARTLDETFEPPAAAPELAVFTAGEEDPRVTIEVGPDGAWVADQYPVEDVRPVPDGRLRIRLAATERAWLERLLLRLGPTARVVEGDGGAAAAAARVLARYRRSSTGPVPSSSS